MAGKTTKWLEDHVAYAGDDCLAWPFCDDGRDHSRRRAKGK